MDTRYLDYSRVISVMAQQGVLSPEVGQQFCEVVLPQLVAELEVMLRVAEDRWAAAISAPPAVEPVSPVTQDMKQKPAKKAARRKPRKVKK